MLAETFILQLFLKKLSVQPGSEVLVMLPGEDLLDLRAIINL